MATQVVLKATDASNASLLIGAAVFVDGSASFDGNSGVVTDSNGSSFFILTGNGSRVIQVTATNYQSFSFTVNVSTVPSNITINAALTPTPVQSAIIAIQFIPQVPGVVWQLKSGAFVIDTGVSQPDGTSNSSVSLTFGTLSMEADLTGYQHLSSPTIIDGRTSPYVFTLVANVDGSSIQQGNTNGNSSALTSQPANLVSQVTTVPPSQSEYRYPNSEYDKYFTITGARIYIGNLFIDECNTLQYALQDNAVPIFGYASRYYDALGQGRSLVQGQLALNFVTEGYLYTVLREYKRFLGSTQGVGFPISNPKADLIAQVLGLMATRDNLLQQSSSNPNNADIAAINGTSPELRAGHIQQQIAALLTAMTPAQISSLNNQRERQLKTFSDVVGFDNAVYQDVLFDIRIEFGNEVTGVKRVRYLEKCKLISNEQVLDQSGQPILDAYGFIARRLR